MHDHHKFIFLLKQVCSSTNIFRKIQSQGKEGEPDFSNGNDTKRIWTKASLQLLCEIHVLILQQTNHKKSFPTWAIQQDPTIPSFPICHQANPLPNKKNMIDILPPSPSIQNSLLFTGLRTWTWWLKASTANYASWPQRLPYDTTACCSYSWIVLIIKRKS